MIAGAFILSAIGYIKKDYDEKVSRKNDKGSDL